MTALDKVKECCQLRQDFVLQGGAGSGKTETLKEIMEYIASTYPNSGVACITLTNKAADEIKSRAGTAYHISTIHSFLNSLIDVFREGIRSVLPVIFLLEPLIIDTAVVSIGHDLYKKRYEKFSNLLYRFKKRKSEKVTNKREFDKDPEKFIKLLSEKIRELNLEISSAIDCADLSTIGYNESSYDNIRNFSYGHDGLIKIAVALIERYPILQRILGDRYDFIFVDEYQDTSPDIIRVLLDIIAQNTKATIGLFGDSMQGIYDSGVGDVEKYVNSGILRKIEKQDNFRCSEQVVRFLNKLRLDSLQQKVALKQPHDGLLETLSDRQGAVNLFYSVVPEKAKEDKNLYLAKLNGLIAKTKSVDNARNLMLTNKSIAGEVGFFKLFELFTNRYGQERGDEMFRVLGRLQLDELARLCTLFRHRDYNELISFVKMHGFSLNSKKDKEKLYSNIDKIQNSKKSAFDTLTDAFELGLLTQSEACTSFIERKNDFLASIMEDEEYRVFLSDIAAGNNTANRMAAAGRAMDDFLYADLSSKRKREEFYKALFSDALPFKEVLNYFDYLNDEKPFVTMHKTKGTGIADVIVVLDEYYWPKYDFANILGQDVENVHVMGRKLVYVACSRAISNLSCVRLIPIDEESSLLAMNFCSIQKFDFDAL